MASMSSRNDFFLTLMSDSSKSYFPANRTSHFSVQLPRTINLTGEWNVALAELQYPNNIYNVSENNNSIIIVGRHRYENEIGSLAWLEEKREMKLKVGSYSSLKCIFKTINKLMTQNDDKQTTTTTTESRQNFLLDKSEPEYDLPSRFVYNDKFDIDRVWKNMKIISENLKWTFNLNNESNEEVMKLIRSDNNRKYTFSNVYFEERLALQFGFEPGQNLLLKHYPILRPLLSAGISTNLFVYCDIIEHQLISDVHAQVLHISTVFNGHTNSTDALYLNTIVTPSVRNFLPICNKSFSTVKIELRCNTGEYIQFESGTSRILLHFKKQL